MRYVPMQTLCPQCSAATVASIRRAAMVLRCIRCDHAEIVPMAHLIDLPTNSRNADVLDFDHLWGLTL